MVSKPDAKLQTLEKQMIRRVSRGLKDLGGDLSSLLVKQDTQRSLFTDIRDLILSAFTKIVDSGIAPYVKKSHKLGSRFTNKQYAIGISFDIVNTNAIQYISGLRELMLSQKDGSISWYTNQRVKDIIADGIRSGESYTSIADAIVDQVDSGVFSIERARMIATREIGHAYEVGRRQVVDEMAKTETMEKIRDTVGDGRVTEQCRHNESQGWIPYNDTRNSGDDVAPRNSNPRCRCTTNYRIAE